jgi:lipoic acid synthetase
VLNHNTETVPRLYRAVRSGARYQRTLDLLQNAKKIAPSILTKSGVMVGLGESMEELLEVFFDLGSRGVGHSDGWPVPAAFEGPSAHCPLLYAR